MAAAAASASASADNTQYTRLHITPLDESLLNIVIPSSVLPNARNISYHTIETFHDKRYGFVDLPEADAEKLKKKLNGAVLRGSKMRIEKARPEAIPEPSGETDPAKEKKKAKKAKDKSKKRKREIDVIPGVELEDRKVKRGWTTTEQDMIKEKREKSKKDRMDKRSADDKKDRKDKKDKKDEKKRKIKSKYTDGPECLFKTKLTEAKPAKANDDTAEHKKKKRKGDREVVIHEFEKTVKYPSFLKSSTAKAKPDAVSFEDGVGWVDANGNVVESVSTKRKPRPTTQAKAAGPSVQKPTTAVAEVEDDETSSSGTSSSDEESDSSDQESESSSAAEEEEVAEKEDVAAGEAKAEEKPKSGTETQTLSSPTAALKLEAGRKRSSGSFSSLSITIPPTTPAKVHPLEALYKRPKVDAGAEQAAPKEPEPFSFFDNADDQEEEEEEEEGEDSVAPPSQPPMTPYTKQDFDYRNVRSAAPTPDTAHPSRSFNLWSRADTLEGALDEEDEEEGDEEAGGPEEDEDEDTNMADSTEQSAAAGVASTSNSADVPASEFQKQFWESRGDLNRSWRKRRKMAAKDKRYRENKARAQRAI
ncbi:hypothetical protein SLS62_005819 [Diatrype stigma]|uniref:Uncharacterized protein n=1 Tax=Diatrype stigma TaxID=117547 RepID=A0AAN9YNB3_9PEZI